MKPVLSAALILSATATLADGYDQAELDFAMTTLSAAQDLSLSANREYCGMIGLDETGALAATPPARGWRNSCRPKEPPQSWQAILSSYHTHGAYSHRHGSETPSSSDMLADHYEEIDGWLVTPGGRVWFIDGDELIAEMVCDLACLRQDDGFEPEPDPNFMVLKKYSLSSLMELEQR